MEKSAVDYEDPNVTIGDVIKGFEVLEKIDEGGYGQVFKVKKGGKRYAMKVEPDRVSGEVVALRIEMDIIFDLQTQKAKYFPQSVMFGKEHKYHMLVMDLLGENVKKLRQKAPNPSSISMGTWSRVGIQCLFCVKQMHDCGYLHRDIKPGNFSMGPVDDGLHNRVLYLLDFGISRQYIVKKEFRRARRSNKTFKGTPTYASPTAHRMMELGRFDDLWSLLYMISEFIAPLPWEMTESVEEVEKAKNAAKLKELFGMDEFDEVEKMLKSCNYYSFPDYEMVYKTFRTAFEKSGVQWTDPYDWETPQMPAYKRWKEIADKREKFFPWENTEEFSTYLGKDPFKSMRKPEFENKTTEESKRKNKKIKKKMLGEQQALGTAEAISSEQVTPHMEKTKPPRVPEKEDAPKAENTEKEVKKKVKKEKKLKVEPTQPNEQPMEPVKAPPSKEKPKEEISSLNIKVEESKRPVKMDDGYEDFGPGAASS